MRDTGGPAFDPAPNTMTVNVTPVNDLPVALNDVYLTIEDTPLVVAAAAGVLANDSGLGDGGITLSVLGAAVGGTVVVNNDGSFTFTPTANFNGPASFTYQVADADGDLATATVDIAVAAVNDDPAFGNNAFTITDAGTLAVTGGNLSASDVDDAAGSLVFTVSGVSHGYFVLTSSPAVAITGFTQADIAAGHVQFVHDGSGVAPAFTLYVADTSSGGTGPIAANIVFNGGGGPIITPPGGGGGGGGGGTPITPLPPVLPQAAAINPTGAPGASTFLRGPNEPPIDGGENEAEGPVVVTPAATAAPVDKRIVAEMALPPSRTESEWSRPTRSARRSRSSRSAPRCRCSRRATSSISTTRSATGSR